MARSTYARPATYSTEALRKAMHQFFADIMTAGGITKTTDTGQINFATATFLDNANSILHGYEIREFTDTLAGTFPIRVRVEYRNGVNGNTDLNWWISAGTGSDGAGNLTGLFMPSTQFKVGKDISSVRNCFACSEDGNLVAVASNRTDTSTSGVTHLGIERTRDQNGDPTSDGLTVYHANDNNGLTSIGGVVRTFNYYKRGVGLAGSGGGDTTNTNNRGGTCAPPDNVTTGIQAQGNEISVYRAPFYNGSKIMHPMKSFVAVFGNDYAAEGVHTLNIDDDPAEYVGLQKLPWLCRFQIPSTMGTMMRYTA